MNFLQYRDAHDMLQQTGLSPQECLKLVNIEIENIRRKIGEKEKYETKQERKQLPQ